LAIRSTLIELDLAISFPTTRSALGRISGIVKHSLVAMETVDHVVFDTSFLKIHNIFSGNTALKYFVRDRKEPYGSALTIHLPMKLLKDEIAEVSIQYETTDQCTAIQWLAPEQTFGGKYPFMYSPS
jgi:leukotriene-A4 hydrolase